jgi:hypothetical protein
MGLHTEDARPKPSWTHLALHRMLPMAFIGRAAPRLRFGHASAV